MHRNKITTAADNLPPRRILRFEFNAACARVLHDHPHLADKTTFVHTVKKGDAPQTSRVYAGPAAAACALADVQTHFGLRQLIATAHKQKSSFAQAFNAGRSQAVVFTPHSILRDLFPHRAAMLFFEFDHECGHLLVRNGLQRSAQAEMAADAYAALRAIQRFGGKCPHLPVLAAWRAQNMLEHRSRYHMTGLLLDGIIADSRHVDFTTLTPAETVAAANDYAARFACTEQQIAGVLSTLDNLQGFKTSGNQQIRLAQIALATQCRLTFHTAARALMPILSDDIGARLPRHSRAYMVQELEKRALTLGMTGLLAALRIDAGTLLDPRPAANENRRDATVRRRR